MQKCELFCTISISQNVDMFITRPFEVQGHWLTEGSPQGYHLLDYSMVSANKVESLKLGLTGGNAGLFQSGTYRVK